MHGNGASGSGAQPHSQSPLPALFHTLFFLQHAKKKKLGVETGNEASDPSSSAAVLIKTSKLVRAKTDLVSMLKPKFTVRSKLQQKQ